MTGLRQLTNGRGARQTSYLLTRKRAHGVARNLLPRNERPPLHALLAAQPHCNRRRLLERTMRPVSCRFFFTAVMSSVILLFSASTLIAQDARFHNAPASSNQLKNPYAGQSAAIAAGAKLYTVNCGACHGIAGRGTGNIPALAHGPTQSAPDGEVFWFITTGSVDNGMPSWASLPEQKRWQIVTYLRSLKNSSNPATNDSASAEVKPVKTNAPPPQLSRQSS